MVMPLRPGEGSSESAVKPSTDAHINPSELIFWQLDAVCKAAALTVLEQKILQLGCQVQI